MFIADVLFVITLRLQTVASHEPGMEGGSGVQRRVRDQAARQRRGSIKSRIVQFSKVSAVQYSTVQYSTMATVHCTVSILVGCYDFGH